MKRQIIFCAAALTVAGAFALSNAVWFRYSNGLGLGSALENFTTIAYGDNKSDIVAELADGSRKIDRNGLRHIEFGTTEGLPEVVFSGAEACVNQPDGWDNPLDVTVEGAHVVINLDSYDVDYPKLLVSGSTTDGQLKIYSTRPFELTLNNVSIANESGSALNIQCDSPVNLKMRGDAV